jgi:hypothetical protein
MARSTFSPREQAIIRARAAQASETQGSLVVDPVTQEVFRPEPHIIEVPITTRNPLRGTLELCGEYMVPNGIDFSFTPDLKPLFRIKPVSTPEANWKRVFKIIIEIMDAFGVMIHARIYDAKLEDYENPQVPEDNHYRVLGRARAGDRIRVLIGNETQDMREWDIQVRLQSTRLIRQLKRGRKCE